MDRATRWESRTEGVLTLTALTFLVAYAIPIIWPGVAPAVSAGCGVIVAVTWAVFAVDYVVRLCLSADRRRFVRRNVFDLAVIALPLLRPLRLLRLVTLLSVLNRTSSRSLRGRVVTYASGGTLLLVVCGALAITSAERGQPSSTIDGFGDGLWWAVTTLSTVGYGDTYPVTTTGRLVAVTLMLAGITLLGVVTATLASWLVERVADSNEAEQVATRRQVEELTAQIRELRREIGAGLPDAATPDVMPAVVPVAAQPG